MTVSYKKITNHG